MIPSDDAHANEFVAPEPAVDSAAAPVLTPPTGTPMPRTKAPTITRRSVAKSKPKPRPTPRAESLEEASPDRPYVPAIGSADWSTICGSICMAQCCRHVAWTIDEPQDEDDWDRLRRAVLHEGISVFFEDDEWFLLITNRCSRLMPDNSCGTYDNRPDLCRDYVAGECEYPDGLDWDVFIGSDEDLALYRKRRRRQGRKARLSVSSSGPGAVGAAARPANLPPIAYRLKNKSAVPPMAPASAARLGAAVASPPPTRSDGRTQGTRLAREQLPVKLPARDCLSLTWDIDAPTSESDFDELRWAVLHENVEAVREDGWWHLLIKNRCSALTDAGTCSLGENRPASCKEHHFADGPDIDQFLRDHPDALED